ncbi:hypothetical protein ASPFODRAFT_208803 [Aspergillus luchuensis CBS 106.47]|uniref:Uncharacterized protein n=1 Tax=Aspergillus luchuensis (strain CBS 106.47) TaxID=1137211 RepID=A0A1M3TC13_ASPLC|nr:hypothetical protein ASPFODRAFT_208803 [Aspergillus luchuensis CBS 106.47]
MNKVIQTAITDAKIAADRWTSPTRTWMPALRATQASSSDDESDYISSLQGQTTLTLPDGRTCNTTLGANPDPVDVYWCQVAAAAVNDTDGALAQMASRASSEVADGNYTTQDIG